MRPLMLVSLLLVLPVAVRAQDRSDFYVIHGFTNPALKAGHYMVSVVPHFTNVPYEYTFTSGSFQTNIDHHYNRAFDLAANSVYGISDQLTLGASIGYAPKQTLPNGREIQSVPGGPSTFIIDHTLTGSNEQLNADLTLSYRPRSNVEVSVFGRYGKLKNLDGYVDNASSPPTTGNGAQTVTTYDVWLSFVVLSR